jgi:signal transduction histidine kinase
MSTLHPDWNAVLGHELRTPVSAILGYQELLEDGTLGPLPPAAADALDRIRLAARQLVALVDAVEGSSDGNAAAAIAARDIIDHALDTVRFEAEGRATRIDTRDTDLVFVTRRIDACRALALILGAAVKVTPAGTLTVAAGADPDPLLSISGANLDPVRDTLARDRPLTGAGLRLELARAAAARVSGSLDLHDTGTVLLRLPRLPLA